MGSSLPPRHVWRAVNPLRSRRVPRLLRHGRCAEGPVLRRALFHLRRKSPGALACPPRRGSRAREQDRSPRLPPRPRRPRSGMIRRMTRPSLRLPLRHRHEAHAAHAAGHGRGRGRGRRLRRGPDGPPNSRRRQPGLLGHEAALFVPTGSMGNQLSLRVHARPGTEVILEGRCHIFHYEMAGMAALSGLLPRPIDGVRGRLAPEQVAAWIRPDSVYYLPRTSVLALENTHNFAGGAVTPREATEPLLALAKEHGLKVHLDGARLWNAAAALGVTESFARGRVRLRHGRASRRGSGRPSGSAVSGSKDFIAEARRVRKLFGGGMRQAGVIAAAALVRARGGAQPPARGPRAGDEARGGPRGPEGHSTSIRRRSRRTS